MTLRFVIDAQLPPGLVHRLVTRGYAAEHVNRIDLGGSSDTAIWNYAAKNRAILITKDEDFVTLAGRRPDGPPIVWIRLGNISNDALWKTLDPLLDEIVDALKAGETIIEVV